MNTVTNDPSSARTLNEGAVADTLGTTLALLLLRLWLGFRALQTGIEKFAGVRSTEVAVEVDGKENAYGLVNMDTEKFYSFSNMHGIPRALYDRLLAEPLIPQFALNVYDAILAPLLLVLGVTVLLGIGLRVSLFVMGLVYTSLTFGLILIGQDAGVAWLGIHVLLIVLALLHARYNRFSVMKRF